MEEKVQIKNINNTFVNKKRRKTTKAYATVRTTQCSYNATIKKYTTI